MLERERYEHSKGNDSRKVSETKIRTVFKKYWKTLKNNDRQMVKDLIKRFIKKINIYENRIELEFNPVFLFPNFSVSISDDVTRLRQGSLLVS